MNIKSQTWQSRGMPRNSWDTARPLQWPQRWRGCIPQTSQGILLPSGCLTLCELEAPHLEMIKMMVNGLHDDLPIYQFATLNYQRVPLTFEKMINTIQRCPSLSLWHLLAVRSERAGGMSIHDPSPTHESLMALWNLALVDWGKRLNHPATNNYI